MSTLHSKINKCRLNGPLHASCTWEPHVRDGPAAFWIPTVRANATVAYLLLCLKHEEEICHFPAKCLSFQHGCVPSAGGAASTDPVKPSHIKSPSDWFQIWAEWRRKSVRCPTAITTTTNYQPCWKTGTQGTPHPRQKRPLMHTDTHIHTNTRRKKNWLTANLVLNSRFVWAPGAGSLFLITFADKLLLEFVERSRVDVTNFEVSGRNWTELADIWKESVKARRLLTTRAVLHGCLWEFLHRDVDLW